MTIEEEFDLKSDRDELIKMSAEEFVKKTKELLHNIDKSYSSSWYNRKLDDIEYDIAPCYGCKGCGFFKKNDIEIKCAQEREQSECYERLFDHELFTEQIEQIVYGKIDFYQLLMTNPSAYS